MIPFIPSTAPFTPEQRAWLNGYFVGLLSNAHGASLEGAIAPAVSDKRAPLLIGFGSQSGSAEGLARRIAKESATRGFEAQVLELNAITLSQLSAKVPFLIVTSTWGDGDPPDNATEFWKLLSSHASARFEQLSYAVLALGDRNYSEFCGAGRKFDERLASLGGRRIVPRTDCDVDFEAPAAKWIADLWAALPKNSAGAPPMIQGLAEVPPAVLWSRTNPFPARLLANRVLNGAGSIKETRHIEIDLEGSNLTYEPGDALGVMPQNCRDLVRELIALGGWNSDVLVTLPDGTELPLELALLTRCDLRKPASALLDALAKGEGCEAFCDLLPPENKPQWTEYIAQREVIDLLLEFPSFRPDAADFVAMLGKLQPRLYSISSSLRAFPNQVHLTVGIVRYESSGRKRKGLCSTFLAERVEAEGKIPVFVQKSHGFKLPADPATPVIMVGPGTGVAPFRAFLHERRVIGAEGKNWLFFGDQQAACDFLYRDELDLLQKDGVLTRLDTAFSRDQNAKIYVQNRMLEHARELWNWLEQGAHFYVCGDARRMAKDVDAALRRVLELAGKTCDNAADYLQKMKEQKRYQRDVY